MSEPNSGWAVTLRGEACDIEEWIDALKQGFDPWTEVIGNDTVLRSPSFDCLDSADEVRARGLDMIDYLNGAVGLSQNAQPLSFGGVIFIDTQGRKHITMFAEGAIIGRAKVRGVGEALGPDGVAVPATPRPSEAQAWARIAETNDQLQEALAYFGRATSWFNLYKTLECITLLYGGEAKFLELKWASAAEIKRLKRSANALRHAKGMFEPPPNPMGLQEARSFLATLLRRALTEA